MVRGRKGKGVPNVGGEASDVTVDGRHHYVVSDRPAAAKSEQENDESKRRAMHWLVLGWKYWW
jgi:hypothetical protein